MMAGLTLDLFMQAHHDFEQTQYRVLGQLQQVRQAFARTVIYPHLGDLIKLHGTLQTIVSQSGDLRSAVPGRIKKIDLETQEVVYERPDLGASEIEAVEELIHWALPHLQDAIEEGRTIFEFVEENLRIEEVGLVPSYTQEGYLLVPDYRGQQMHVLQYQLSIFTSADERFRSLKTTHVKSIAQPDLVRTPSTVKMELMEERRELPNPATYLFETDLAFPYTETMLPVAKRKLLRYLCGQTGQA